ncbi:MAG: DegT/DnrJ/EryC1/StrS family aminotransferase [Comamonadaceae bacterium]|nr:DegT/DnrJ/EryC1/StrS family aminotransferase [Comamonadaceae bacterium]
MKRFSIEYADWSHREYATIARNLLRGRVHQGPATQRLALQLAQMYAPSDIQLLNYGHHAIEIALSIFKERRPERMQVVGPAYICPSVLESVKKCGLQWRSVDVREDLNIDVDAMARVLGADTLAVIAPHMYGCPADIEAIEDRCHAAGTYLIDDAAQVVGVEKNGRLLGTFGDMGIVSFAQSKMVVTGIRGSGGMLLVNNASWRLAVEPRCAALAPPAGRLGPILDFLWNHLAEPYTGHTGYYLERMFRAMGLEEPRSPGITKMANLEAAIALVQLDRLESILASKRRVVQAYEKVLKNFPALRFAQYGPGRALARVVLEVPVGVNLAAFRKIASQQGVQTRKTYPLAPDASESSLAFSLSNRLVGVPCGAGLTEKNIEHICTVLVRALRCAQLRQCPAASSSQAHW